LRDVYIYYGGRYYVSRAEAPQTRRISKLLQQSSFRPLARVRYEIVGQDHVFEQLFTILNQHSKTHSTAPLVILLCGKCIHISLSREQSNKEIGLTGPSGHGKSFLARRGTSAFGNIHIYLLCEPNSSSSGLSSQCSDTYRECNDLTIHARPVGFMFNESLRGMLLFHEFILQDPVFVQELSTSTLSQFLIENEGKRCVVVLDVRSQRSAPCQKKPKGKLTH